MAVREGMLVARGQLCLFMDADGATQVRWAGGRGGGEEAAAAAPSVGLAARARGAPAARPVLQHALGHMAPPPPGLRP